MTISADTVRILVGDTDEDNQILTDDQLTTLIALYNDTYRAAAGAADAIAAKFARRVSMSVDGASFNYSDLAKQFRELAIRLRTQAVTEQAMGVPVVTGISLADMDSVDSDTDRDPNRFKVGMSDFPGVEVAQDNDTDPALKQ